MKNKEVIELFLQKKEAKGSNLYSDGHRLVNYNTTLAEWYSEFLLIVNNTGYSVTTSKNQGWIKYAVDKHEKIIPLVIYNVPMNTKDLTSIYESLKRGI